MGLGNEWLFYSLWGVPVSFTVSLFWVQNRPASWVFDLFAGADDVWPNSVS